MPYCLGNLSRLRTLDLSNNQLKGNLSSFVSGLPSALEYLSLFQNNFNGSFLFNSLVNHTRLTVFKLSSKVGMIQAQVESSWFPQFQLKMLMLQNFILGSTIPGFLVHQHDLCFVDISYSQLTGAFPTWLVKNNTRLQTLLMNSNSLTKLQLPRLVHGLQVLDISSNKIYGSVQEDIGIFFPDLRYMNFASNHFHGTIPSSMGEMKSLVMLDVSSNALYGQLPKNFISSCYSLRFIKLSNNQFHGKLFSEHANLTGLVWLFLDGNHFNGSQGKGLLNSKNLIHLDISNNNFSGTLPLWIGRMSSLLYLYMRGNQLEGPFPRQLQGLHVIDISHNRFSGSIPMNYNFSSLRELRLQSNEFMGLVPDTLFKAEELEVLDLRNNNFSGKIMMNTVGKRSSLRVLLLRNNSLRSHIPEKICQLSRVRLLDLSNNKFKGYIPSCLGNISKMKGLESLDLSNNKLDRSIPPELADLNSLRYFNISYNNLSGEIPFKGNLVTFDESSYIGNFHLCGLPTNKICNPTRAPEPSASKEVKEEEGDVVEMVWFYWTCGAVYISTALALSAFLCIDSRWSREWFYRVDLFIHHLQRFKGRFLCN